MKMMARARLTAAALGAGLLMAMAAPAHAVDLGIEGQVFEPIEEDLRIAMMRLVARHDWSDSIQDLKESAENYTKNLPAYILPRAQKTETVWKDVGVVVSDDIYLPWIDWQNGSVFEPQKKLAIEKGTYINPIAKLPSAAIERLFVFDATDPEQLEFAKDLMRQNIPQLSFMLIAGDLGPLAKEMNRPIYHPPPTMLEKFHITSVPTLIGFGRGPQQGHMAITSFKLPSDAATVKKAWFGLPYQGYDPENIPDVPPVKDNPLEQKTRELQDANDSVSVLSTVIAPQHPSDQPQQSTQEQGAAEPAQPAQQPVDAAPTQQEMQQTPNQ
jgi:hypothetical protein